jgi:uncharacterized protein
VPHNRLPANGVFVWHHLATADPGAAAAFYLKLFGWATREIRVAGTPGETTFRSGEIDVATAGEAPVGGSFWLPCLAAADFDSAASRAGRLGATLDRPSADATARVAVVIDPVGARFGITGNLFGGVHATDATAPGRVCWTELMTDDPERAAAFYEAFTGWARVERHRGQEGRYWVFRHAGRDVAGMVQEPEAKGPSCWVPYVQVVSAEDTAALAQDLGGTVVTPPGDIPGRGRYAVLRDPCGALVGVFALTDAA